MTLVSYLSRAYIPSSWIHQLHNICVYFKFTSQLLIRKCRTYVLFLRRTCNGSRKLLNWESRSRCKGTLENASWDSLGEVLTTFFFQIYVIGFCSVGTLYMHFSWKPPRETLMSCETQRTKAFDLPTWEFVFPFSEIAMQMRQLTSKGKPKWQRWLWSYFCKEFALYLRM